MRKPYMIIWRGKADWQAEIEHIHACGFIGIKTYVELRRKLNGIRIGHVKNGSVIWE